MANEPLAEIIQGQGQSETSPVLSPTDEFANFEMWKYLIGTDTKAKSATGSYLRQAYGVGQGIAGILGALIPSSMASRRELTIIRRYLLRRQVISRFPRPAGQRSKDGHNCYRFYWRRAFHKPRIWRINGSLGRGEHS